MPVAPPTLATPGHGALVAMELDPTGAQGTFTVVAEQSNDLEWPELSRPETDVTPHTKHIDAWVLGVLQRGMLNLGTNWVFDDHTHDHLTGALAALGSNEIRGFLVTGPGGSASSDGWVVSGQVQKITRKDPVRTGVRSMNLSVRLSGNMIIDGVVYDGT